MSGEDATGQPKDKRPSTGKLLVRGSAWQVIAFSFAFGAAFFLMPFLIHALGQRGYGLWVLIGTITSQLGLFDVGLMTTTQRFMANALANEDHEEATSVYSTSMVIFIGLGTLVFIAVAIIAFTARYWLVNRTELHNFQLALVISGFNAALLFPFAIMQGALASKLRSDATAVAQIASTAVRLMISVAAIYLGYGIVALAVASLAASAVQRIALKLMMNIHLAEIRFRRSGVTWARQRELFAFGRYVFLGKLSDAARYRFDNLIIAPLIGIAALTHYAVAVRLVDYFQGLAWRLSGVSRTIYSHHFARGEEQQLREKFLSISRFVSIIACVFAVSALAFGRRFIFLWLGPGFDDSYFALAVLLVGILTTVLQVPSRDILAAIYKHPFDAKTNVIEVIVNLILTVLLIPSLGIVGAAFGTAIPMVVVKSIALPIYVCRQIKLDLSTYYRATLTPLILASAISGVFALLFPINEIQNLAVISVAGLVFSLGMMAVLMLICLPRADKAALLHAIGRGSIERIPGGGMLFRTFTK